MLPEMPTALIDQITDISYAKTPLGKDAKRDFWLPREVNVRWELPDLKFANRHRYSEYKLFAVSSDYSISKPKPDP
jgi:hypothetical protein